MKRDCYVLLKRGYACGGVLTRVVSFLFMFTCYPSPSPYLPPRVKRSIFPRVSPVSFISHNFSTQRRQLTSIVSPHLTYLGDMIGDALCVSHLVVKWEAKENGGGVVRCSVSVSFSFSRRTDGGGAPFPGRPASAFVTGFFANAVGAYRGASGARRSSGKPWASGCSCCACWIS